ncbi:MAG: hypothetical protein HY812_07105 [Planctomycetes bacterium]|nr:hypothetical protein [Planctomycetota bacterium]
MLIAGGSSDTTDAVTFATSAKKSTEIFNPSTGLFSAGPDLSQPKTFHEAVTLADGRVLISGGLTYYVIIVPIPDLSSVAQVYTPNAGSGSFGGNVTMGAKRAAHTAVLLNDGRALLVGGATGSLLAPTILATCELFNPASGFSAAGGLAGARAITSLVKLPAGQVLASGGAQGDLYNPVPVGTCELYTPVTGGAGSWAAAGSMNSTRSGHGCLILSDGSVGLIAGGGGAGGVALDTAEVYQP